MLRSPLNPYRYKFFQSEYYSTDSVDVTTILPIDQNKEIDLFKHRILTKYVAKKDILAINSHQEPIDSNYKYQKITEFFDWIKSEDEVSYYEMHPERLCEIDPQYSVKSLRYIYEMLLPDDARQKAFKNTPKQNWDNEALSIVEGMKKAFDWSKSPEGYDYWNKIVQTVAFKKVLE